MEKRFKTIRKIEQKLYCETNLILIEKYAFLYDSNKGKYMIQVKMRNVSIQTVANVVLLIRIVDSEGNILEELTHPFTAVNAIADTSFGDQEKIYLDNLNMEKICFYIKKIQYDNGTCNETIAGFFEVGNAEPTSKYGNYNITYCKSIKKMSHISYVKNAVTQRNNIWYCACGNVQEVKDENCRMCELNLKAAKKLDDLDYLKQLAMELANEEQKRKEEVDKRIKKIKKIAFTFCITIALAVFCKFLFTFVSEQIELNREYNQALEAIDNHEYDRARKILDKLGDYKDSEKKEASIEGLEKEYKKQQAYEKAEKLLECQKYEEAIDEFRKLGSYSDSKNRINECHYQWAVSLKDKSDYKSAIEKFDSLGAYQDAKDMSSECYYQWAEDLLENNNYEIALEKYENILKYKDVEEKIVETKYNYAQTLVAEKNYTDAITLYEDIVEQKKCFEELSDIYYEAAMYFKGKGAYERALQYLQKVTNKDKMEIQLLVEECNCLAVESEKKKKYELVLSNAKSGELDKALEILEELPEDYEDVSTLRKSLDNLRNNKWIGTWQGENSIISIKVKYVDGVSECDITYNGKTYANCELTENAVMFFSEVNEVNSNVNYDFDEYKGGGWDLSSLHSMKEMSLFYRSSTQIKLVRHWETSGVLRETSTAKSDEEILVKKE